MSYLIKKWYLPKEKDTPRADYSFKPTADWLDNLSKVNIFIGPNNSGKSRFMRYLLTPDQQLFSPTDFDLDGFLTTIKKYRAEAQNIFKMARIAEIMPGLFKDSIIPFDFFRSDSPVANSFNDINKLLAELADPATAFNGSAQENAEIKFIQSRNIDKLTKMRDELTRTTKSIPKTYSFKKIYIPTLRGLRPLNNNEDSYFRRTLRDYFNNDEKKNLLIFSGLELYQAVRLHLLGDLDKRMLIAQYETFLSNNFFENQKLSLVPREEGANDVLFVKIGKEKEYPIFNLGDGIQQLIIMTFPLFLYPQENILLFIEEPELYLHPGMQRILLKHLTGSLDQFRNLQVFLTTHSNHFLDLSLDFDEISIYKFSKELQESKSEEKGAQFFVKNTLNKDRNLLEDLGVKNSSVFLSNCTIWVEGITDRFYIRKYLSIYMKFKSAEEGAIIYEEDRHFSFVEYSGNNITHWSFLDGDETLVDAERLCGTLFLIADKDDGNRKSGRHAKLRKALGDRYYRLKCREIENLLLKEVLIKTVRDFKNAELIDNTKIVYNDYRNKALGGFIDKNILTKTSQKTFSADSGTLNCKVEFARKAISHINNIQDMSKEAQVLAKILYDFIKKHNQ